MDFKASLAKQINYELLQCVVKMGRSIHKSLNTESISQTCRTLADEISSQRYQPSIYSRFAVTDPKLREIYAPSFRDRLVQCWLVYHINPYVERVLIDDTFANRKNKGTLAAVQRVQRFMRQPDHTYYLQLDIQNFFNAIPRTPLLTQCQSITQRYLSESPLYETLDFILERCILHPVARCTWTVSGDRRLLNTIPPHKTLLGAGSDKGLPLGSSASQMFANLWLSPLDHFIKHSLKARGYVRYMDDLFLLGSSSKKMSQWRELIASFCASELSLTLHPKKQSIQKCSQGADYLGYRVYPHHLHMRNRNIRRFIYRLHFFNQVLSGHPPRHTHNNSDAFVHKWAAYLNGTPITPHYELLTQIQSVINSYLGMMQHTQHWRLRKQIWHRYAGLLKTWFIPADANYGAIRIKQYCKQDWIVQQYRG
ncbi:RNA-directed DNA polymerase [Serratia marcescens]|uniref:RNA-directed DNA polymerase n=1 Tax=Serratia marcescens TaxID=615 RepID=UPI00313CC3D6